MKTIERVPNVIDWSRPVEVHCIDDRGYKDADQNIKLGGASAYGLAFDTYAARYMNHEGRFDVDMSAGEAAKAITRMLLSKLALQASVHHGCAAEKGVLAVADQIVNHGELILPKVNLILGGSVDERDFEKLQRFHAQLGSNERMFRGVEAEAASMDNDGAYPRIARAELAHEHHKATVLTINTQKDTWHDAATEYALGNPTYHADSWAMPRVMESIDTIMPHDNVDGALLAWATRTAAITRLLPRDSETLGVDIVVH